MQKYAYNAKRKQGKTDLQISNFVQIINALGMSLQLKKIKGVKVK